MIIYEFLLIGKHEGKGQQVKEVSIGIRIILKGILRECDMKESFGLIFHCIWSSGGFFEYGNETSVSIEVGELNG